MADQRDIADMGGTMRLGLYPCALVPGTQGRRGLRRDAGAGAPPPPLGVQQRLPRAAGAAGLVVSGTSPDGRLVEIIELRDHPWFVGTQFHPELKSRPTGPHPLFRDFIGAAMRRHQTPSVRSGAIRQAGRRCPTTPAITGMPGLPEPVHAGAAETQAADAPGA